MAEYRPRIADELLAERLDAAGAVLVEGAKYCGKTTTCAQQANSILFMADPDIRDRNLMMAETNVRQLLQGATPRLIDEWQIAPKIWDGVRTEVDRRNEFGQFILTGSAVPANLSDVFHSGTGRISRMKLRTMSLWESGDSTGDVRMSNLFKKSVEVEGSSAITLDSLASLICRGGWPRALYTRTEKGALMQSRDYFDSIVDIDISRVDGVRRDRNLAARLMRSLARLQGSQAGLGTILADIKTHGDRTIGEATVYSYINALKKLFVIEDSAAWNPNLRSKTAIRTSDTRYYSDPSIATAALGVGPSDLVADLNTLGLFFETLAVRDLRVYADALDGEVYHYRDQSGLECDAVVHLRNGRYGLVEIKLGGTKLIDEGAQSLLKLASRIDSEKMSEPSFMMVLTGVGEYAYKRTDGVLVVPIGSLRN